MLLSLGRRQSEIDWDGGDYWDSDKAKLAKNAMPDVAFAKLPPAAARPKSFATWRKSLANCLYRTHALTVWKSPELRKISRPGEDEGQFRVR